MKKLKGISGKTFLYTAVLMTLIIVLSFGILYMVLPDYYLYSKNKNMLKNVDILAELLHEAKTETECIDITSKFLEENNATIFSFDKDDNFITSISTPFISTETSFEYYPNDESNNSTYTVKAPEDTSLYYATETKIDNLSSYYPNGSVAIIKADSSLYFEKIVDNDIIYKIIVTSTLQPIDEAKNIIVELLPYLMCINLIIALIASYIYSKRLTDPIIKISDTAQKMRQMKGILKSNIYTNDELGLLSSNLDSLYSDLCKNIEVLNNEISKVNQLEKSKTDFMRAAGHELKTPIAALNGITEGMIDNIGVYKDKDKYLLESKKLIHKLAYLVNEILNASKIDNLDAPLVFKNVDIYELLEQELSTFNIFIQKKNLNIIRSNFVFSFTTDKKTLASVFSNILSNAIKYTNDNGEIRINLSDEKNYFNLSIENQCLPVSSDELSKFFEPFYTSNFSRDKTKSGTGLGLYIVKRNLEILDIQYSIEQTDLGIKFNMFFIKDME